MSKETAHETDVAAADWAARIDRRPLSASEEAAFRDWLSADVRRPGAFARMRAIALQTERARALGPGFMPSDFGVPYRSPVSRRALMLSIGGAAASITCAGLVGWKWLEQGLAFTTRKGELRIVSLEDGSVITLNTASRILVYFSTTRRDVHLLEGEAFFDVAKDSARPFVVAAGSTEVRAVGTSFAVTRLNRALVQVLVREGVVEVTRNGKETPPLRVAANTRAVAAFDIPTVSATAIPVPELQRDLAWREGRIAFEGQTLDDAVAEFARYSDTKIIVDDPAMGHEEIAGLFQANDPIRFAKAVATSLNGRVVVARGEVRLSR